MTTQMMDLTHNQLLVVWVMMAVFDQIPRELEEEPRNQTIKDVWYSAESDRMPRVRFLDSPIEPGVLSNDEVNVPSLSPELHEEFILPYELELCQFHGRIVYWHSCGNTSDLAASIAKIPILDLFHIGPWTDLDRARKAMMRNTAFEKCLMPTTDAYFASPESMAQQLDEIRNSMDGSAYTVRADAFQVVGNLEENLAKVKQWCAVARKKLHNETFLGAKTDR